MEVEGTFKVIPGKFCFFVYFAFALYKTKLKLITIKGLSHKLNKTFST